MKADALVKMYFMEHSTGTVHDIKRFGESICSPSRVPPIRDITSYLVKANYRRVGIKHIKGMLSSYPVTIWGCQAERAEAVSMLTTVQKHARKPEATQKLPQRSGSPRKGKRRCKN